MLNNTIRKGNQCGRGTQVFSLSQEAMRGTAPAFPPVSSFDEVSRGLGAGRQTPTHPPLRWQKLQSKAFLSPLCVCVCEEPSNGCSVILTKTDILHRENTSPLGFFSFIIGIS